MGAVIASSGVYGTIIAHISTVGFESCGSFDVSDNGNIYIANMLSGLIGQISIYQNGSAVLQRGPAQYAIRIDRASSCAFENINIRTGSDGSFLQAGIGIGEMSAVRFKNVNVFTNLGAGAGPFWKWTGAGGKPTWSNAISQRCSQGVNFESCNFDSALPVLNLPLFPSIDCVNSYASLQSFWCSDSNTTTPGTAITAVATATATVPNTTTTLVFGGGIPAQVANGWRAINITSVNAFNEPAVVSGAPSATTLSVTAGNMFNGVTDGDVVAFTIPTGGSSKVLVKWNGSAWVID